MSRTYGKRSFAPENVNFTQNWNPDTGKDGRRLVERLIPTNILLEAYDNPCTTEELSLALGVAVPYIEDEVGVLTEYGLLLKEGNRYKTGIVVLSRKMQEEFYALGEETADRLTPVVRAAIEELEDRFPSLPQPYDDFKPVLVGFLTTEPMADDYTHQIPHTITHPDGAQWALLGLELTGKPIPFLELWGNGQFNQIMGLGNRNSDSVLAIDPAAVPAIRYPELMATLKSSSRWPELESILKDFAARRDEVFEQEIPAYLRDTAYYSSVVDFRRLVLDRLIASGDIVLHEDMTKSAMGVYNFAI